MLQKGSLGSECLFAGQVQAPRRSLLALGAIT